MANRTIRTPENRETILTELRAGNTRKGAYLHAGVGHTAFADWIKADAKFLLEVEQAESAGNRRLTARVMQAAEPRKVRKTTTREDKDGTTTTVEEYEEIGDWRAAIRVLEVRDPENWAKQVNLKREGDTVKGYGAGVDFDDL